MENNAQNKTSLTETENTFKRKVTLRELLSKSLRRWYWFLISLGLFIGLGVFYILRTSPVYHREAVVLINDARRGGAASELSTFADIAGIATRRSVDNELYVLQSRRLMADVVDRLNLTVNYTIKDGLRTNTLYRNTPVSATFIGDFDTKKFNLTVQVGKESAKISGAGVSDLVAKYGDTVAISGGKLVLSPTQTLNAYVGKSIQISKGNKDAITNAYHSKVDMSVPSKTSSIINLSLDDVSAERAEDILNTLIAVYNEDAIKDKRYASEATAKFIDERLAYISEELINISGKIKQFKDENNITDIKTEATNNAAKAMAYEKDIVETRSQIAISTFLRDHLNDNSQGSSIIPVVGSFDGNNAISAQIASYNEMVIQRSKLGNASENNPLVQQLDNNIASTKSAVLSSLASNITALEIKLKNAELEQKKNQGVISAVPKQEQEYLSIARQQKIIEELYLYLSTKKEENAIAMTIAESPARIVDYAFGPDAPVSPKKFLIMLAMVILGLGLPLLIIYLRIITNTKIQGKHDIVKYCTVPYLGDIPIFEGQLTRSIAVRESGRDKVSEAFKILRTNMGFMSRGTKQQVILTTSSNAHAGKTFVSMNLGMTLAFSGNKVLMVDLDLRRRTLSKHMGQRSNPNGATKYLSSADTNINDIITNSGLHENFDFIYAGLQPPNPSELLMSKRLDELFEECRKQYDYIIIDSVPALIIADALITSRVADLSIYVVRDGLLERQQLPDINALHTEHKLNNMCIVLNGASEERQSYGYSYRYQYASGSDRNNHGWRKIFKKLGILK